MLAHNRLVRFVAGILLVTQTACMTAPRPVASPAVFLKTNSPSRIWVQTSEGRNMMIRGPRMFGDTLLGTTADNSEVWVPVVSLREVRVQHVSALRTGALVAGTALLLYLGVSLLSGKGAKGERCPLTNPIDCEG